MGINSSFDDISEKLRKRLNPGRGGGGEEKQFWMREDKEKGNSRSSMCYECDRQLDTFNRQYHCCICGRAFCGKCTHSTIQFEGEGEGEEEECRTGVCNSCFTLQEVPFQYQDGHTPYFTPQLSPSPSVSSFFSCEDSGDMSANLFYSDSDEDEYEEYHKDPYISKLNLVRPPEEHLDDNITNRDSAYLLDEMSASGLSAPNSMEQGNPTNASRKTENLENDESRKCSGHLTDIPLESELTKSGEESDGTENALKCRGERPIFQIPRSESEQQMSEYKKPFDINNNASIFIPPPPENEDDETEFSVLDEDEDDDDGGLPSSSDSFSSNEYRNKDKLTEEHRMAMKAVVDEHFRFLVAQLLRAENIPISEENDAESWKVIVSTLAWQAASYIKPDASEGRAMDPVCYIKVKCVACGNRSESKVIKGVVFKKNIVHKHMPNSYKNPRLLLLGGALEYQPASNQLSSLNALMQQEIDYLKAAVARIEAYHPNVLLVEKTVSRQAQEFLLAKEISVVLDVKRTNLERLSRCTGAQIVSSLENLNPAYVKHCELFHVEKFVEEHASFGDPRKKSTKTLMFFEGCTKPLGCTILLKGASGDELKKVKFVVQYAVFAAYHLALETSFLADERATLPRTPFSSAVNVTMPNRQVQLETSICRITDPTSPIPGKVHIRELQTQNRDDKIMTNSLVTSDSLNEIKGDSKPTISVTGTSETTKSFSMSTTRDISIASEGVHQKDTYSACESFSPPSFSSGHSISGLSVSFKKTLGEALPLIGTGPYAAITSYFGIKDKEFKDLTPVDISTVSVASGANHCEMALEEPPGTVQLKNEGITDNKVDSILLQSQSTVEHKQEGTHYEEQGFSKAGVMPSRSDYPSILVSLSRRCILKGTVCERNQITRIKYYGSFDMSLGRFLRDKLFNQNVRCNACEQPPDAHAYCYTHQEGRLMISLQRIPQPLTLPGEREGKIWMWHRCLKCEWKDGLPQPNRRVLMSDAASGLSFGKFLELSFSNNAASRVASCGHSLHRDCLRFYGLGSLVACFHYSSINILSVHLPPAKLEFNNPNQQDWLRKEATEVTQNGEEFFLEVFDLIHQVEEKISSAGPYPTTIFPESTKIAEVEGMLQKERAEFEESLQMAITKDWKPGQPAADILELNRLRRKLIFQSYIWDKRLCYLHSSLEVKRSLVNSDSSPPDLNGSLLENINPEKQGLIHVAQIHDSNIKGAKISEEHNYGCTVNNVSLGDKEVPVVGQKIITGALVQSPRISGIQQDSNLVDQLTEAARVDLIVNSEAMKPDQMSMNEDDTIKDLNPVRQDRTHQAVSDKYSTDNNNSEDRSVGRIGTGDMLDTSEKDLGVHRRVLEGHSCNVSNLSDKLDAAWTGYPSLAGQAAHVTSQGQGVVNAIPSLDNSGACCELPSKMVSDSIKPSLVPSMVRTEINDSSSGTRDIDGSDLPDANMPLSVVRTAHFSNYPEFEESLIWEPFSYLHMIFSNTPQESLRIIELISDYKPVFVSSAVKLLDQGGAKLLLPTGIDNTVIAVYEDEPTSLIAYAVTSKQHQAQISDDQLEEKHKEKDEDTERDSEDSSVRDTAPYSLQNTDNSFEGAGVPFGGRTSLSEDLSTSSSSGSNEIVAADTVLHTKIRHAEICFGDENLPGKGKYSVICYCAKQFNALRKKSCPTERDFICSLSRCKKWGAQGGKSKVFFAKTLDDRFIIKQVTKTELESFLVFAPEYFKHLTNSLCTGSPTCLAKILGIYQVTVKHPKGAKDVKMDLMVMENLLFGRTATRIYDLKGSLRNRYNTDSSGVLLDQNFIEAMLTSPVFVGNKAKHLLERAVWNDTSFLTSINVMDYSLLVGVDEERRELILGIIDYMRQYTWDKHLETWVKASGILGGPKNEAPTVISPREYKKRFRKAMSTYFQTVPDLWSSNITNPFQSELSEDNTKESTEEQAAKSIP